MGIDGAGSNGGERGVTTLTDRHMLACSVGGIVRSMTVVGGHGMPEGAPCGREASHVSRAMVDADPEEPTSLP